MSTTVAAFPVRCIDCRRGFDGVYPLHDGNVMADLGPNASTLQNVDDDLEVRCPRCDVVQPSRHLVDWYLVARKLGVRYRFANVVYWCASCGTRVASSGRCQRCIRLDYHNINSNPRAESCPHCERFTLPRHLHEHHISYEPEETMTVCVSCHGAIHAGKVDDELEPEQGREEWLSRR